MALTSFEKAVINELQGIKKELHELNKKKLEQGQVDGVKLNLDMGKLAADSYKASIERGY